jgi:predicted lactoylglutathione lyase
MTAGPFLLNFVVTDLGKSIGFYRDLGWDVSAPTGPHAVVNFLTGIRIELDQSAFADLWNSSNPGTGGGRAVISVPVPERDDVDALWHLMTGRGHASRQRPYDAFWGSRFAILADPDGYQIGIMSPEADEYRHWPPTPAPR